MILTVEEKRMLNGEKSPGEQLSMVWLKKYGEAFDAERMAKVDIVHMSTNVPLNLIDQMTEGLTQIRTPCSLHAVFNPTYWREKYDVIGDKDQLIGGLATADEEEFSQVINAFKRIGCIPCFTCVPYAVGFVLRQDDIFLGTGSSGQIVANSIFAARAGRDSTVTAFASAITGVTPYMGLLIKENRYAEVLIEAEGINFDKFTNAHYGALGYYIGEVAGPRNVVISGLPRKISLEKCKFLKEPNCGVDNYGSGSIVIKSYAPIP